ncbi:MAG: tol-pal system protein YbgF [Zoogloeaceae bacterium]|jgi:tol-pal system protein YbgF|nr:tol-pal system protein YbgF [Zoogloeaceae bacterium]
MRPALLSRCALGLLCAASCISVAQAGLFDDNEARRQIRDMQAAFEAKLETQSKAQLELATQLMGLREEISRLRGEIETLNYENAQAKKRLQDLYLDLDGRLARMESTPASGGSASGGAGPAENTPEAQAESQAYENALAQFKAGKYAAAAKALADFVRVYPNSEMTPGAQFWLGNAYYAQKQCREAIDAQLVVTTRWPDSTRAPDALLTIANCQRDMGNQTASRRTLTNLIEKYPTSQAATQARQRVK